MNKLNSSGMRPGSIIKFENVYLASILLSIVSVVLEWNDFYSEFDDAELAFFVEIATAAAVVLSYLFGLILWFFVGRRASNIAKWILIFFFVVSLIMIPFSFWEYTLSANVVQVATLSLQAIAIYMLFRPDAVAWFKGDSVDVTGVFD